MRDTIATAVNATSLAPLIGNPDAFPILRHWDFYNHAGVAPIAHVAAEAMRTTVLQAETTAYLDTSWYRDVEALRKTAAQMIGASREEIAFIKNTSEGLATVANGIEWKTGDRIVTSGVEYPANMYPWMDVRDRFGVELVMVAEESDDGVLRVPIEPIIEAASHPRTKLVALSHVEYGSGQRLDIARIGRFCRERGILFSVDAIQSVGVLPVDVAAMNIDYLSADGHKWMLGPEGAGIFYCRRESLPRTRPLIIGWMNVVDAGNFADYHFTLKPDAAKFECGSWNITGLHGLKASLELLQSVGVDAIAARIEALTGRLIVGLTAKGYRVVSPRGPGEFSGIVSFISPSHDHDQLVRRLRKEHRIELAVRCGRLRASPHFYNTEQQIDRLIETLPGH